MEVETKNKLKILIKSLTESSESNSSSKLWIFLLEVSSIISAPIFLASSIFLDAHITVADCFASCFTTAKPIPEVVPVTT